MFDFNNKWVQQILALQQEDGSWGHFSSRIIRLLNKLEVTR
jgi:hypothetical protein